MRGPPSIVDSLPPGVRKCPCPSVRSTTATSHRSRKRWIGDACTTWARELFDAAAPFATGGVYVNFMPEDETDRVGAAYGPNHERLVALKDRYDPANLFRMNQNIRPSRSAPVGPAPVRAPA